MFIYPILKLIILIFFLCTGMCLWVSLYSFCVIGLERVGRVLELLRHIKKRCRNLRHMSLKLLDSLSPVFMGLVYPFLPDLSDSAH